MRKRAIAATLAVLGVALTASTGAQAAPIEASVRIEGIERTLFEGPITTEGHDIRAASDTEPRPCEGTNLEANPEPGPTPTAASVDAMELIGQDFDGTWFEGFEDYGIERWGPDSQNLEAEEFWALSVNWELAEAGGCQVRLLSGDRVLWVYDGFSGRKLLRLAAAGDPSEAPEAPAPYASVEVGQPLGVEVESFEAGGATAPAEGITVAPVSTEEGTGYQEVDTESAHAEVTDAGGSAEITFPTPGWHRIKAQEGSGHVRSNRLDVCVEPEGGGGCGAPPADSLVRVPPRYLPEEGEEENESANESESEAGGGTPLPIVAPPPPRVTVPSARFGLRGVAFRWRTGMAQLRVRVRSAGYLVVFGRGIVKLKRRVKRPGVAKIAIRPKRRARRVLRRRGRLVVPVKVGFRPLGGKPRIKVRRLKLRMRPQGG